MANRVLAPERQVIVWVCLLFVLACFLPCIDCGEEVPSSDPGFPDFTAGLHFGLVILLLGWSGDNNGVPWSANVFLALGLASLGFRRYRTAAVLGIIASTLGLTTLALNRFSRSHDIEPLVGYYFWQGCQLVLAVGALWARQAVQPDPKADNAAADGGQGVRFSPAEKLDAHQAQPLHGSSPYRPVAADRIAAKALSLDHGDREETYNTLEGDPLAYRGEKPVVVALWATWASVWSAATEQIVRDLQTEFAGECEFAYVEAVQRTVLEKYRIDVVPTVLVFQRNQEVGRSVNLLDAGQLRQCIEPLVATESGAPASVEPA
jgi:hypothetical protein